MSSSGQSAGKIVDPSRTSIDFSNVTCIYPNRGTGIVEPLNLSIAPLTTTVVTGPSGAGKSTLLSLIERFVSPTSGSISIEGVSIAELDIDDWRRQIAWVPQRPSFFSGSVVDNLRIGAPDARDSDIAEVVTRLFPDFAGQKSLSSLLSSDGRKLSGGEQVRLALGRALLRQSTLLLLDEPTSFLDPEAAENVARLLHERAWRVTTLIATHEAHRFPCATNEISLSEPKSPVPSS